MHGVRWDTEITSDGPPWTTGIITQLTCRKPKGLRFWTAWSDPQHRGDVWRDPLAMIPLVDRSWHYGNAAQVAPVGGDFISIPLVTLASPNTRRRLQPGPLAGRRAAEHDPRRFGIRPRPILADSPPAWRRQHGPSFSADLIGHEADWRGGLRWMAGAVSGSTSIRRIREPTRWPAAGHTRATNARSTPPSSRKWRFRINWKLSDDFPYMGMFIPPVKNADERWTRSCDEQSPPGKPDTTSCRQMNDYAKWMRQHGFHVLSYFNVTEFGKNMKDRDVSKPAGRRIRHSGRIRWRS